MAVASASLEAAGFANYGVGESKRNLLKQIAWAPRIISLRGATPEAVLAAWRQHKKVTTPWGVYSVPVICVLPTKKNTNISDGRRLWCKAALRLVYFDPVTRDMPDETRDMMHGQVLWVRDINKILRWKDAFTFADPAGGVWQIGRDERQKITVLCAGKTERDDTAKRLGEKCRMGEDDGRSRTLDADVVPLEKLDAGGMRTLEIFKVDTRSRPLYTCLTPYSTMLAIPGGIYEAAGVSPSLRVTLMTAVNGSQIGNFVDVPQGLADRWTLQTVMGRAGLSAAMLQTARTVPVPHPDPDVKFRPDVDSSKHLSHIIAWQRWSPKRWPWFEGETVKIVLVQVQADTAADNEEDFICDMCGRRCNGPRQLTEHRGGGPCGRAVRRQRREPAKN